MNRYTVYLNRPAPDDKVVVFADRHYTEDRLDGRNTLVFVRGTSNPAIFHDWTGVVEEKRWADEESEHSAADNAASFSFDYNVKIHGLGGDDRDELAEQKRRHGLLRAFVNDLAPDRPLVDVEFVGGPLNGHEDIAEKGQDTYDFKDMEWGVIHRYTLSGYRWDLGGNTAIMRYAGERR